MVDVDHIIFKCETQRIVVEFHGKCQPEMLTQAMINQRRQ